MAQLGDVGARDERFLPGAGEDDHPGIVGVTQLRQRGAQVGQHDAAQGVADLGPVDGDQGDSVEHVEGERLVSHCGAPYANAGMPVRARPMIRMWTSSVPS